MDADGGQGEEVEQGVEEEEEEGGDPPGCGCSSQHVTVFHLDDFTPPEIAE